MDTTIDQLLHAFRGEMESLYGPRLRGVYLYGSFARGTDQPGSDVDILVVLDDVRDYGAEIDRTGEATSRLSLEHGLSISRVFAPQGEWAEGRRPFFASVREEAVPV